MTIQGDTAMLVLCLGFGIALSSWGTWRVIRELNELDRQLARMPTLYSPQGRMKRKHGLLLSLAIALGVFLAFDGIALAGKIIGNG